MGLYLTIFERQAKFLNIPERTRTAYLIGSLPPDIAQLISRQDEDDAQNMKSSYLEDWIKEFKTTTFDQLKSLIIADQIKRKTPANIKEYFLDIWADLNDPLELAEKLDAYDSLSPGMKKKSQPVGGSRDNHSPGPSRTVPGFPSYKTKGRNPIQCCGCGTPGVVKSKCTRANEMETAVNCMTLFNLNSTCISLVKFFSKFLEKRLLYVLIQKQYKFFKKTLGDITLRAFELRDDEGKNLSPEQARKLNILLDRNDAYSQPGGEPTPFTEHRIDTSDHPPKVMSPYRINPVKKQDCQKENFDRRRRKYYNPGDKVWVTIHPVSRNNRSRKFMPKREGPYFIFTLRSPVTYEIADPANPDQALGTYHVSDLRDYQEPETERNPLICCSSKEKRTPKKRNYLLVPSRDVNEIRGGVCNTRIISKTEM
ncbi:retrovirus-related Pol polyprotein from transposon 297 [Trichonephila clavipes]|nr:retrovirus-related Pol polyprotein from transposon 297 [Trichonephila clavipes]